MLPLWIHKRMLPESNDNANWKNKTTKRSPANTEWMKYWIRCRATAHTKSPINGSNNFFITLNYVALIVVLCFMLPPNCTAVRWCCCCCWCWRIESWCVRLRCCSLFQRIRCLITFSLCCSCDRISCLSIASRLLCDSGCMQCTLRFPSVSVHTVQCKQWNSFHSNYKKEKGKH